MEFMHPWSRNKCQATSRTSRRRIQTRRKLRIESLEERVLLAVVNVIDYGAVPNDGADDLAAINAAVNAASAGDTVFVPTGDFSITGSIRPKSGVTIEGAGRDSTTVTRIGGGGSSMIDLNALSNVQIADLTLDGSGSALFGIDGSNGSGHYIHDNRIQNLGTDALGIRFSGAGGTFNSGVTDSRIVGNLFSNIGPASTWGAGIRMAWGSSRNQVLNNTIDNTGRGGIFANDGSTDLVIMNNTVTRSNGSSGPALGIEVHTGCDRVVIANNDVDQWLSVDGCSQVAVRNNVVHGGFLGLEFATYGHDNVFSDNSVTGTWGPGISVSNAGVKERVLWSHNTIQGAKYGAEIQDNPGNGGLLQKMYFYQNTFSGNVETGFRFHPNYPDGTIQLVTLDGNTISGNSFGLTGGDWGPKVQAGAAPNRHDKLTVINNTITGNWLSAFSGSMGAWDGDDYLGSELRWAGNILSGNRVDNQQTPTGTFFNNPPSVSIVAPASVGVGQPVNFSLNYSGPQSIGNVLWDLGDGVPETVSNPVHSYSQTGTYGVGLVVWDALGRSAHHEVTINVVQDITPPATTSFTRLTPVASLTAADTLVFRATFDEPVSGVDAADFEANGSTAAISVTVVSDTQYDVTLSGGDLADLNGVVGLNLSATPTVADFLGNALPNTEPATDQTYLLDNLGPSANSFARKTPASNPTEADTLVFLATFSENVTGVAANDFVVTGTTASISVAQLSPSTYDVTISGGNLAGLTGPVGLNFSGAATIRDAVGNDLLNTEPATDEVYDVDNEVRVVLVSESGGSTIVSESGTSDTLTVALSKQPASDVVLTVSGLIASEAKADVTTLTFTSANWNTAQIVTITGIDDVFIDGSKTMNLVIQVNDAASDLRYRDAVDQIVQVVNQDNEVVGLIVSETGGTTVVTEAGSTDTVTVRLIDRPLSSVVLTVLASDSSEATALPATLTFTTGNWNIPQTVTVTGVNDDFADGSIGSVLRFSVIPAKSNDAFDLMPDVTAILLTADDEVAGFQVLETAGSTVVNESGTTDTVDVRLTAKPASDVVFTVSASDPGEATGSPLSLTFTPTNWNAYQTVTVTGVNDLLYDGSQISQLTIAVDAVNSHDVFDALSPSVISVTTTDDEPDPPIVTGPATDTRTHFPVFTWTAVAGAVSYDVWVTDLSRPAGPVIKTTVTGTSLTSQIPLEIARHRVWVRANLSSGIKTPWSVMRTFEVRTPPVVSPLARMQITYRPTISWSPVYNADSYQVQIDSRFSIPSGLIFRSGITSTSFVVPQDLPLGLYRVWIRALATNGNYSAWSNPGEFYIAVFPTTTGAFTSTFDTTPTLRWNPVLGAREYRVRIFNVTTSRYVVNQAGIGGTEFTSPVVLSPGLHRWDVRARGDNGVVGLSSYSNPLYIGGRSQILTPIGSQSANRPVFSWQAVEGVFTYSLYIVRTSGAGGVTQVNNLITNTWTPAAAMAAGTYRVWVQAVSTKGQLSPWSLPADFSIAKNSPGSVSSPLTGSPLTESSLDSGLAHGVFTGSHEPLRTESVNRHEHVSYPPEDMIGQSENTSSHHVPRPDAEPESAKRVTLPQNTTSHHGLFLLEPTEPQSKSIHVVDAVLADWNQLDWWSYS